MIMPPAITALAYAKVSHDMLRVASTHNAPAQDYENPARWDPSRLDRKRRLQCLDRLDKICVLLPEYANYYELDAGKVVVLPNAVTPAETPVPARQRAPTAPATETCSSSYNVSSPVPKGLTAAAIASGSANVRTIRLLTAATGCSSAAVDRASRTNSLRLNATSFSPVGMGLPGSQVQQLTVKPKRL